MDPSIFLYIHPFRYRYYAMGHIYYIYVKFEPPPPIWVGENIR